MMTPEIKTYSEQQMDRLTQFKRAEGVVTFLREHQSELDRGITVITPDRFVSRAIDRMEAKIIRGAFFGMFEEIMDLGLREEIISERDL